MKICKERTRIYLEHGKFKRERAVWTCGKLSFASALMPINFVLKLDVLHLDVAGGGRPSTCM